MKPARFLSMTVSRALISLVNCLIFALFSKVSSSYSDLSPSSSSSSSSDPLVAPSSSDRPVNSDYSWSIISISHEKNVRGYETYTTCAFHKSSRKFSVDSLISKFRMYILKDVLIEGAIIPIIFFPSFVVSFAVVTHLCTPIRPSLSPVFHLRRRN